MSGPPKDSTAQCAVGPSRPSWAWCRPPSATPYPAGSAEDCSAMWGWGGNSGRGAPPTTCPAASRPGAGSTAPPWNNFSEAFHGTRGRIGADCHSPRRMTTSGTCSGCEGSSWRNRGLATMRGLATWPPGQAPSLSRVSPGDGLGVAATITPVLNWLFHPAKPLPALIPASVGRLNAALTAIWCGDVCS